MRTMSYLCIHRVYPAPATAGMRVMPQGVLGGTRTHTFARPNSHFYAMPCSILRMSIPNIAQISLAL